MERILIKLALFLFLSSSFSLAQTAIAVFDLKPNAMAFSEARTLTERLRIELQNTRKFTVVERKHIDKIIKEQGFQLSGVTSSEYAVKVGELLGVEKVVVGNIGIFYNGSRKTYSINARLISVTTGNTLETAIYDYNGNITHILKYGLKNIAYQLAGLKISQEKKYSPPNTIKRKALPSREYTHFKTTVGLEWGVLSHFRNGKYMSIWLGGSDYSMGIRFRGWYFQKDIPNIFYNDGFENGRIKDAYGLFLDFSQGEFRGFWGGLGITYQKMSVGHKEEIGNKDYELAGLSFSFGVLVKLLSNFYLNLWLDAHTFMVGDRVVRVGDYHTFVNDKVNYDFSIALGWHF